MRPPKSHWAVEVYMENGESRAGVWDFERELGN